MYLALDVSYLLVLALAVLTAGFLLRTFILFHDCTHGSLLRGRRANARLGAVLGMMVFTPFARWRHDHTLHHATAGDLDRRGAGDIHTLTVSEYNAKSWRGRLAYRMFRNPVVMFGIGPLWGMMIAPRWIRPSARRQIRRSTWGTNLALAIVIGGLCWLVGWRAFVLIDAPIFALAGAAGIWLFYVQHQFDHTYWQQLAGVELHRGGAAREFLPAAAEGPPVLHRQHRSAPRASPQHEDPQLQPATRGRRRVDLRHRARDFTVGRTSYGAPQALGCRCGTPCDVEGTSTREGSRSQVRPSSPG